MRCTARPHPQRASCQKKAIHLRKRAPPALPLRHWVLHAEGASEPTPHPSSPASSLVSLPLLAAAAESETGGCAAKQPAQVVCFQFSVSFNS